MDVQVRPSVNNKGYVARDRTPLHLGGSTFREGAREPSTQLKFDGRQHEDKRSESPPAREVDGDKKDKGGLEDGESGSQPGLAGGEYQRQQKVSGLSSYLVSQRVDQMPHPQLEITRRTLFL
jgi:hypothetical protein